MARPSQLDPHDWDRHKALIIQTTDDLKASVKELERLFIPMAARVENLSGKISLLGGIAGAIFGAVMGAAMAYLLRK